MTRAETTIKPTRQQDTHLFVLYPALVRIVRFNVFPDSFELGHLLEDFPLVLKVDAVDRPVPLQRPVSYGCARRK
jgi:hypothetical protein